MFTEAYVYEKHLRIKILIESKILELEKNVFLLKLISKLQMFNLETTRIQK